MAPVSSPEAPESSKGLFDLIIEDPKLRRVFVVAAAMAGKGLKSAGQKGVVKLVSQFSAYQDYLVRTSRRVSTIKTFAAPTTPVSLMSHFVDTYLTNGQDQIDQVDLLNGISNGSRIIISALAGFGKSVLMRYLALSLYETPSGKIPIFVELRDLNRVQDPDIVTYIHASYNQSSELNRDVFELGLQKGLFCIFLDGFDEINFEHRKAVQSNILELSENYPKIAIYVSGRPDPTLNSWQKFTTLEIKPMELVQVQSLIMKIEYDDGLKSRFLAKLEDGLYERHASFLSTPLLATLMMLTYEQNANIPDKMHLFYQRAFETLFDKHDTYKEQYERKRKSNLRIDEFSQLFSAFCMSTYLEESFEFSKSSILEAITSAISYCGFDVDPEDVLFDLTESVCLIQLEGLFYSFVHRSFQEYFSALFLCHCPDAIRNEFFESLVYRPWDSVLTMLYDMAKDRLDAGWISGKAAEYRKFVEEKGDEEVPFRAALARWSGIAIRGQDNWISFHHLDEGRFSNFLYIMSRFHQKNTAMIDATYLTMPMVDQIVKGIADEKGLKALSYREFSNRRSEFKSISMESISMIKHPNAFLGIIGQNEAEIYRLICEICDRISEQHTLKQKLLTRLRGK